MYVGDGGWQEVSERHWSGRQTGSPITLGPSLGTQHSHRQGCGGVGASGCIGLAGGVGCLGGQHGCRASRGVGALGAGRGVGGASGHWDGRWTGIPTTFGLSSGLQHSHWQGCRGARGPAGGVGYQRCTGG